MTDPGNLENDNEDKWIVSLNGETIPAEDILEAIGFQEQYFMGGCIHYDT